MHRLQCAQIWGGIFNQDQDVCTSTVTASVYSASCDGGKGGDLYYFSVCKGDKLTRIAVADVVGHGEAVSDVSSWLYTALEKRMNSLKTGAVLKDLNKLATKHGMRAMTTATVAAFYMKHDHVTFASAGHHPMMIRRATDDAWWPAEVPDDEGDRAANLPLGVLPNAKYGEHAIELADGDRIMLYTDGVLEAPDAHGNLFGADRLNAVLNGSAGQSPLEIKQAVLEALRTHTGGDLSHDDVTLLAVEIHGRDR